jgi:hypothetical protein
MQPSSMVRLLHNRNWPSEIWKTLSFLAKTRLGYSAGWLGGLALRSWEIAVTTCAGAKGFASKTLLGTPLDAHSSP